MSLFADVRQVCTVVDDFERTVKNLVDHLGIGPFRCWHWQPPSLSPATYRGRPEPYSMKVAMAWLDDVQWEVIAPVAGRTIYRDHLEQHGRGVQHILMNTGTVRFRTAIARLEQRGQAISQTAALSPTIQIGRFSWRLPSWPGLASVRIAYANTEPTLKTTIEVIRYPLGLSERFTVRSGKVACTVPETGARFEDPLPNRRVGRLFKVTIVTRDLDAVMRSWIHVGGVAPWRVFDGSARMHVGWAMVGHTLLEIVEPRDGHTPYHQFLSAQGEGVSTLGLLPGREGFDALVGHCQSLGYTCSMQEPLAGAYPAAFVGARAHLGTDLEILAPAAATPRALFEATPANRTVGA